MARGLARREDDMDERISAALRADRLIDITTTGRASGQPRRIEMGFFYHDGELYLTGTPGKRDWHANLLANPAFTLHVKQSATADLPARATPIVDATRRAEVLRDILERIGRLDELDEWLAHSPLVAVTLEADAYGAGRATS
jgi:deazaflavin-dependent oxidoreductase (nitroreductase family)